MPAESSIAIARNIKTLPPLPLAVRRLCSLADDPDADLQTVNMVIASDQALASRILRITNSAFYGLSQRISTISQAVVVIGLAGVKNLALSVALCGNKKVFDQSPFHMQIWRHALAAACAARRLAAVLRMPVPEESFTAGLLHDIGILAMLEHFGTQYERIFQTIAQTPQSLYDAEHKAFEVDHCEVGEELCRLWKIPEATSRVVGCHHAAKPEKSSMSDLQSTVCFGDWLAALSGIGDDGTAFDDPVLRRMTLACLPPGLPAQLLRQLPEDVAHFENLLGIPTPPLQPPSSKTTTILQLADHDCAELLSLLLAAQGLSTEAETSSEAQVILITDTPPSIFAGKVVDARTMPPKINDRFSLAQLRNWLAKQFSLENHGHD